MALAVSLLTAASRGLAHSGRFYLPSPGWPVGNDGRIPANAAETIAATATDFIEAVKSRGQTMEDVEVGQRTISICHLAHIGIKRQGALLKWDPARERFTNDDEANRHLEAPAGRGNWGTA